MNNCIWNIETEKRNCKWCVVLFCQERKPQPTNTITATNNGKLTEKEKKYKV